LNFKKLKELFDKKNQDYGNSHVKVGDILNILFPHGTVLREETFSQFGILIMLITKLVRVSNLMHNAIISEPNHQNFESMQDSLDDMSIYAQMLSDLINK